MREKTCFAFPHSADMGRAPTTSFVLQANVLALAGGKIAWQGKKQFKKENI